MATTRLTRFALSNRNRRVCLLMTISVAVLLITVVPFAQPADDPDLKVLKLGLGSGTVRSDAPNTGIDCGATCLFGFGSTAMVTLRATADTGSRVGRSGRLA